MAATTYHKFYAGLKKISPRFLHQPLRSIATAILTPIRFSIKKGHFKSSLLVKAVDRHGTPIPWYTYPCIDFLRCRSFEGMKVLEFGAGQSTLWWAKNAAEVVSFEGNKEWYDYLLTLIPANVTLRFARADNPQVCVEDVTKGLSQIPIPQFDMLIIDGLWRSELIEIAKRHLKENGAIICDNAEPMAFMRVSQMINPSKRWIFTATYPDASCKAAPPFTSKTIARCSVRACLSSTSSSRRIFDQNLTGYNRKSNQSALIATIEST